MPVIKTDSIPGEKGRYSRDQTSLIDAAFHIPGNSHLQLDAHGWRDKASAYLDHAVSRTPQDLRSHVQRVYLHIERRDGDALFGGLVDMFIALQGAGRPLRQRLLETSRTVLDEQHYQFLLQHLETGIKPTDAILPCRKSLLSKGLSGTNQLVIKQDSHEPLPRDPLQEAHEHLEYGQIDEAREVLEAAILKDPQRQELHLDLLEIYRSTRAKEAFQSMRGRIDTDAHPAAAAWQELTDLFAAET